MRILDQCLLDVTGPGDTPPAGPQLERGVYGRGGLAAAPFCVVFVVNYRFVSAFVYALASVSRVCTMIASGPYIFACVVAARFAEVSASLSAFFKSTRGSSTSCFSVAIVLAFRDISGIADG